MLVCNENSKVKSVVSKENHRISIFDLGITGVEDTKLTTEHKLVEELHEKRSLFERKYPRLYSCANLRAYSRAYSYALSELLYDFVQ